MIRKASLNLMMKNLLILTESSLHVEGNGSRNKFIVSQDNMLSDIVILFEIESVRLQPGPNLQLPPPVLVVLTL